MAIFKCKMCGGDLNISEGITVTECEYCGTKQTVPMADNEKKLNLFNRANRLRLNSEFDKAASIYESIVAEFPEEAEAYWGLVICNYGIEYVDDPATAKKIPTCHRASFDNINNDENYKMALECADVLAQKVYRDEAREIERLREEILNLSKNEKPYDVFICYKETAENGQRTVDSVLAEDVYERLIEKGYRVFFSRITLEDKIGQQYEPYIFAALNSAKVMLAFGTKYEYYHAVWVKNEWSRFIKLMAKDKSKALVPCYKDMDPYDMPDEFKALQAQDMGKVGAMQDLLRGIDKILGKSKTKSAETTPTGTVAQDDITAEVKNYMLYTKAVEAMDSAKTEEEFKAVAEQFDAISDYKDSSKLKERCIQNAEEKRRSALYDNYISQMNSAHSEKEYKKVAEGFKELADYKDSSKLADECLEKAQKATKAAKRLKIILSVTAIVIAVIVGVSVYFTTVVVPENNYKKAVASYENKEYEAAARMFLEMGDYKNSNDYVISCRLLLGFDVKPYLDGVTDLVIPEGVTAIGENAFYGCTGLTSVTIPNSVTAIGENAFYGCTGLTSVTIPNSVTAIEMSAFRGCTGLTSVTIPDSVTAIGTYAFSGCTGLTSVTIPNSVATMGANAFSFCTGLTDLVISEGITNISTSEFASCRMLKNVTLPKSIKVLGENSFSKCFDIENVYYGGSKADRENIIVFNYNANITKNTVTWHYNSK